MTGSPSSVAVLGSAPALSSASMTFALPFVAASVIGAQAVAIGGLHVRAGLQQHPDQLDVVGCTA